MFNVKSLYASYNDSSVLSNVNVDVMSREIVGLCGPNNAGKSTLCRCLVGSKKIYAGEIFFDEMNITKISTPRRLQLGISLCPEGRGIYPEMSVLDNLKLGCNGISRQDHKLRIDRVFSYFPVLSEKIGQQAGTLSGGQAQMLGIARKLLREPRLIIVDEPCIGLSPVAIDAVFRALLKIRDESGTSILVIEEGLESLADLADRAYVLHLGTIIAEGKIDGLVNLPSVVSAFTGESAY